MGSSEERNMRRRILDRSKRSVEFRSAFFAIVAVSLVAISVGNILTNMSSDYNVDIPYDLQPFDSLEEMQSTSQTQVESITVKSSVSGENFEGTILKGVASTLNTIFLPFNIVFGNNGMLDIISDRFGIPSYIPTAIGILMFFGITFTLIAIFFKLGRPSA